MLISANNALTLVLDNEYDAEEEHVIGGHIATVYTYVVVTSWLIMKLTIMYT